MRKIHFILSVFLMLIATSFAMAQSQTARVEYSQVSAISSHQTITLGKPFQLGILIVLDDHWHTYWKNGGDTGFPAQVNWHLPDNMDISGPAWPAPEKIVIADLVNYIHEGKLLLAYDVVLNEQPVDIKRIPVQADVSWLMCWEVCIPATATIATELVISDEHRLNEGLATLFERTKAMLPSAFQGEVGVIKNQDVYQLSFPLNSAKNAVFIPNMEGTIIDIQDQQFRIFDGKGYLTLKEDPYGEKIEALSGLLQLEGDAGVENFAFSAPIRVGAIASTPSTTPQTDVTLWLALVFAFIAGLILNLMPCVLPVLFLKIMGLVHHAHGKYNQVHLFSFLTGVLLPFWGLGLMLISLKQAGEFVGWGFHLQSPAFVGVLILIMLLISLNLFGFFELGNAVSRLGSKLKKTEGHGGAFASGILMTIVATPCTVPFMGGAMAYGLSQPMLITLAVFTSLGVGMATPYMFLACAPKALKWIPKPGAWMTIFRKILGIPMLLTAVWLYWVFSQQTTPESRDAFAFSLLAVIFASWIFGRFYGLKRSALHKTMAVSALLVSLLAAGYLSSTAEVQGKQTDDNIWQTWSQAEVDNAIAAGETVFIDFTADWCITCQVMDRTVLSMDKTHDLFTKHDVRLFKADWTLYDEEITKALEKYGRKGVPLYVMHKNGNAAGIVLPQIITYSALEEHLRE
jgi:thiol:disulfide interchange protein DsbD